jgi:hypothetical protein
MLRSMVCLTTSSQSITMVIMCKTALGQELGLQMASLQPVLEVLVQAL